MTYQKDYILRMIEMMGELIAALLGLIRKGNYSQARIDLDRMYPRFLTEEAAFFEKIPIRDLTSCLLEQHNYSNGHLEILSELFYAEGELRYHNSRKEESLVYYRKAIILLKFIIQEEKTFSLDKNNKIKEMEERILAVKH